MQTKTEIAQSSWNIDTFDGAHPTSPFSDILSVVVGSLATATDMGADIRWRELR